MVVQTGLAVIGGMSLAVTLLSSWADRRRRDRPNIEAVGFMPWPLITLLGTLATLLCGALAVKFA
jgi:hypothetical protein